MIEKKNLQVTLKPVWIPVAIVLRIYGLHDHCRSVTGIRWPISQSPNCLKQFMTWNMLHNALSMSFLNISPIQCFLTSRGFITEVTELEARRKGEGVKTCIIVCLAMEQCVILWSLEHVSVHNRIRWANTHVQVHCMYYLVNLRMVNLRIKEICIDLLYNARSLWTKKHMS